jgi:large subunit ribosomal protein L18
MQWKNRIDFRRRRHLRIRRKVNGTADRPRMAVMVSNKFMYVQFIDDDKGVTLASASSVKLDKNNNVETAKLVGKSAADVAIKAGIKAVVVDRGGFKFHGRVKALVDAAIVAGLKLNDMQGDKEEK